jgi:hypothetical protein
MPFINNLFVKYYTLREVLTLKKISIMAISLVLIIAMGISSINCAENHKPTLEGGALLYTLANNNSSYRFLVAYKDVDGDLPKYMFVYINGSKRTMEKQEVTDNNPKDGILYFLPLTHDEFSQFTRGSNEWNINYYFKTNDGSGVVTSEESSTMTLDYEQMGLTMEHSSGSGAKCRG